MRIGYNPLRNDAAVSLPDKIALVITHFDPFDGTGYHMMRPEVIITCIDSLRKFAPGLPVWVWCNGWLRGDELMSDLITRSDFLTISPNIGKGTARAMAIKSLPDSTIVAVSDDDILFYPSWFEKQMEIFNHFPNVGSVTGYPCRNMLNRSNHQTLKWASTNGKLHAGRFIPDEWERDYALSVGEDYETYKDRMKDLKDYIVEYNGKLAFCTSHHCQFITQAGRIKHLLRYDGMASADERPFDELIDNSLLLRLATVERLTRHIGNVIDDDLRKEIERLEI